MAEVPEVETLVRDLREAVVGRTVLKAEVLQPAAVRYPTVDKFTNLLTDRVILGSQRRAKYILLPLGRYPARRPFGVVGHRRAPTDRAAPFA